MDIKAEKIQLLYAGENLDALREGFLYFYVHADVGDNSARTELLIKMGICKHLNGDTAVFPSITFKTLKPQMLEYLKANRVNAVYLHDGVVVCDGAVLYSKPSEDSEESESIFTTMAFLDVVKQYTNKVNKYRGDKRLFSAFSAAAVQDVCRNVRLQTLNGDVDVVGKASGDDVHFYADPFLMVRITNNITDTSLGRMRQTQAYVPAALGMVIQSLASYDEIFG